MGIYFSESEKGFYDSRIHKSMPLDAVEISREQHRAMIDGQTAGKMIVAEAGAPVLADRPVDQADVRNGAWRRLEAEMHRYIFVTHDYPEPTQIMLSAIYADPDSNAAQREACKAIFDWVKKVVLPYYYSVKALILDEKCFAPHDIKWDFSAACDAYAPGLTLAAVITMPAPEAETPPAPEAEKL